MAASIVASSSGAQSGGSPITCSKPTGTQSGDRMFAHHCTDWGLQSAMTATGWTLILEGNAGSTGNGIHVKWWYKIAGASEPTSYSFGQGSGSDGTVSIVSTRGTGTSFVTAPVVYSAASTSRTCPELTGVPAGSILLCGAMLDPGTACTWTPPTGMTELADVQSNPWTSSSVASLLNPPASTGTRTFTSTTNGGTAGGLQTSIAIPAAAASVTVEPGRWMQFFS